MQVEVSESEDLTTWESEGAQPPTPKDGTEEEGPADPRPPEDEEA